MEQKLTERYQKLTAYFAQTSPLNIPEEQFNLLLGRSESKVKVKEKYTLNSTLGDIKDTLIGKKLIASYEAGLSKYQNDPGMLNMVKAMLYTTPLRNMRLSGSMTIRQAQGIVDLSKVVSYEP